MFKTQEFAGKHISNKHPELLAAASQHAPYFNNYLRDRRRPLFASRGPLPVAAPGSAGSKLAAQPSTPGTPLSAGLPSSTLTSEESAFVTTIPSPMLTSTETDRFGRDLARDAAPPAIGLELASVPVSNLTSYADMPVPAGAP